MAFVKPQLFELGGRTRGLLEAPDAAGVGAGPVAEAGQAMGSTGADPAIERATAHGPGLAVGCGVLLGGQAADEEAALAGAKRSVERFGDQVAAPQGARFGGIRVHRAPLGCVSGPSQPRRARAPRAHLCWSPAAPRRRRGWPPSRRRRGRGADPTDQRGRSPPRPGAAALAPGARSPTSQRARRRQEPTGEERGARTEPLEPAPHGRLGPGEGGRDLAVAEARRRELQGPPDPGHRVPAPGHDEPGQERLGAPARAAAHPGDPDQPILRVAQVAPVAVPRLRRCPARRAGRSGRVDRAAARRGGVDREGAGP